MKKLGKYELLGEIGRGAMGVVYRARDPVINRLVALKTITTGLSDFPHLLQRFYREAQSAGGLQHPNIVTIYDMGDEVGVPYIAMELIEGENLEQLITRQAALAIPLRLNYLLQACRAFDYAHKRGIIHRDIKPGNVMVNKEGVVKVVDFGIARVLETSKTQTGMLIGTFAYMSPEQYHGEHADERSDIWCFGVLLYELLCYQRPFTGETPASLMHSICQLEPRPIREIAPNCPLEIDAIISKVLRKSPGERYQTMEDLLLELDPICRKLQAESVADLVVQSRQLADNCDFDGARDLLRQALQIDSGHSEARVLLENVNSELKRIRIRPKAQELVEKGRSFLEAGNPLQARVAAEGALHLDSSFEPAQALQRLAQEKLERAQLVSEWLQTSKQRLAEGLPDDAETLLAQVLECEPNNQEAHTLQQQVIKEKTERERRLRLLEVVQRARSLWTQQNYSECIALLTGLAAEFPGEEETTRLLETAREDQAEQEKRYALQKARNLLAAKRYDDCVALVRELQKQFPADEDISQLLEEIFEDQTNQRRIEKLAEARSLLAAGTCDECISLLSALQKEFPREDEIPNLLEAARHNQSEQERKKGVANVRKLLADRRYEECSTVLMELRKQFPGDDEILKLFDAVREDQAEQKRRQSLMEARNFLASRRYEECIALLSELELAFPGHEEIVQLLQTAREGQAERQRQGKLAEAKTLLAAERFTDALSLLDELREAYPKDPGISKLRTLVDREQAKHAKSQRLKCELEDLKRLMGAKQYSEVLSRTNELLREFPADAALTRLAEFASTQQKRIEEQRLLQRSVQDAKAQFEANQFEDATRTARTALKTFPDNAELLSLVQQAEVQQRRSETRQHLEQRIREIRFKINREELSEAINLAKQTLVSLGPDTAVTQLLNSAQVEFEARGKKREQEGRLATIRTLMDAGDFAAATRSLDEAIENETLDAFDSRVQKILQETKDVKAGASTTSTPILPTVQNALAKEYAFLQNTPLPDVPAPTEKASATEAVSPETGTAQPMGTPNPSTGSFPLEVQLNPSSSNTEASPRFVSEPQSRPFANSAARQPSTQQRALPNSRPVTIAQEESHLIPTWRRPAILATLTLVLGGLVWAGLHFVSLKRPPAVLPSATTKSASTPILIDPLEVRQRDAINKADKLVASNDLDAARQILQQAALLNGPMTSEIQKKLLTINESMNDKALGDIQQQEAKLLQRATDEVQRSDFAGAKRDLRKITSYKDGGVLKADAEKMLTAEIPRRQREEELFRQATRSSKASDLQSLQRASDLFGQVVDLDGPRKTEAAELRHNLEAQVLALKQENTNKQIAALSASARQDIQQADFNAARQKADQIRQAGSDATALSREIDQAQAAQTRLVQQRTEFRQAVQAYNAVGGRDRSGLEKSRSTFQAIARENSLQAGDAQQYLAQIGKKLDALNAPSLPPPAVKIEVPNTADADAAAIRAVIQRFFEGWDQRNADALKQVWPSIPQKTYDGYKNSFDAARAISMQVTSESFKINRGDVTATVLVQVRYQYTPKGRTSSLRTTFSRTFQLAKSNGVWVIADFQ